MNTREEYHEKYLDHHRKSTSRLDSLFDNHKVPLPRLPSPTLAYGIAY